MEVMAKRINTFPEYDAARRERERSFEQAVQSKLEKIVELNIRKSLKEPDKINMISNPIKLMRALIRGQEGMVQLFIEQQIESHTPQAEREAALEYFQQNMYDLIVCGVSISKPHGSLDDNQKQSFYARFLDNVKELTDSKYFLQFKIRYSGIENLLRGFHPPEKKEFRAVAGVTAGLCREKYITRENADTIVQLLSPQLEALPFPTKTPPVRERTPAPVPVPIATGSEDRSTKEERMEYLTMVLRLPRETAQSYVDQITLQQLDELHQGMNDAVGDEYASKIIPANPGVILYPSENLLTKYLTTLQVVQGRIRSNGDKEKLEQKFGLENNVEKYASLEQLLELKKQLFLETGTYHAAAPSEDPAGDFSIYVARYALLQKIPAMEQRLDYLIKEGELTVGRKEHWSKRSRMAGGARGRNILKNIRTELNHLFTDLGYDSPGCEINFDRHILSIPEKTQQLLGSIRDRAYASQKK